jgi:hypothetical protein
MKKQTTDDPNRATLSALSRLVQADRKTVRAHLNHDGAPQRGQDGCYDRNAAVRYLRAGIGRGAASLSVLEELRMKRLQLEIERVGFDLQVQRGEFYRKSVATPVFSAMTATLVADLRQKFEAELPPRYAGKGTVECMMMNVEAVDWIIARFIAGQRPLTGSSPATPDGGKGVTP